MEQNTDHKTELKEKLITFYNSNKSKIYSFIIVLVIILISSIFIKINNQKKNNLIAEKFVDANIYLNADNKKKSIELYEEIIFSNNKFYSILSLNKILEKNLSSDKDKILKYFKTIEEKNLSEEQIDLLIFKKALYLIKISNIEKGKSLLQNLIEKNSKIKTLAEEILVK
jgi:tetratricopeptide (TPR) repeat protein